MYLVFAFNEHSFVSDENVRRLISLEIVRLCN